VSQYFDVNDPLAAKVDWSPLKSGGANFTTHQLVEEGPSRLVMKLTTGVRVFAIVLIVAGVMPLIVSEGWLGRVLGVFCLVVGGWILSRRSRVFDGQAREFEGTPFTSIHALQVIKNDDEDSERYELNLVRTNGERVHVATHSREQAKQEAQRLGAFIGCKVWDTTAS
jgi:hypothetical protein